MSLERLFLTSESLTECGGSWSYLVPIQSIVTAFSCYDRSCSTGSHFPYHINSDRSERLLSRPLARETLLFPPFGTMMQLGAIITRGMSFLPLEHFPFRAPLVDVVSELGVINSSMQLSIKSSMAMEPKHWLGSLYRFLPGHLAPSPRLKMHLGCA